MYALICASLCTCSPSCRLDIWWLVRMVSCPPQQSPVWSARSRQLVASSSQLATTQAAPVEILASSTTSLAEVSGDYIMLPVFTGAHIPMVPLPTMVQCNQWRDCVYLLHCICKNIIPNHPCCLFLFPRTCSRGHHKQNFWNQQRPAWVSHLPWAESGSVQD